MRILVSLAFGVLAAYSAKQADKYLEIQRNNRKLELELQAVGPYLAPLPEEQQHLFRISLAKRVFGRNEPRPFRKGDKSPATILDVLASEEIRDLLEKAGPQLKDVLPDIIKALPELITSFKKA